MTRAVVFQTPGLIDIRSFTHFGVNAKPLSENPIGYFGTGLKMAIAVLCREKLKVHVWIGGIKYSFKAKSSKFRGKDFDFIVMIKDQNGLLVQKRELQLSFTTELAKNWVLWQAFRELESNTRDEGGRTFLLSAGDGQEPPYEQGSTAIIVEGEKFVQEFLNMEKIFLPDGAPTRDSYSTIQVFERPSKYIYYRGLRIFDLPEDSPSELTYNFLCEIELTEDRTAKNPNVLEYMIKEYLATKGLPSEVSRALSAKGYESKLTWDYTYTSPSKTFQEATQQLPSTHRARTYVSNHTPKAKAIDPFEKHPRPWMVAANKRLLDAHDIEVPFNMLLVATSIINHYDYQSFDHHRLEEKELVGTTTGRTPSTTDFSDEIPF